MMKFLVLGFIFSTVAQAYVPTLESLFRHGGNPDVTANGVVLNLMVKKISPAAVAATTVQDASLLQETRAEDFYKLYFTKSSSDSMKLAQTRYTNASYADNTLENKIYYPNFSAYTIKANVENVERGLFFALMDSLVFNSGSHLVNYLKSLGVPAKLNTELINREKIEYLANYKRYLLLINRDRNARKSEPNPLHPEDPVARARIESVMSGPMYTDNKQVKLGTDDGEMAWVVDAGNFSAVVSYRTREISKIHYKSPAGEFEMICKDYWLADGTHSMPRFIIVRSSDGESYQVEISTMRHYVEKEDDLIKRLTRWDQLLRGKENSSPRPEFLL